MIHLLLFDVHTSYSYSYRLLKRHLIFLELSRAKVLLDLLRSIGSNGLEIERRSTSLHKYTFRSVRFGQISLEIENIIRDAGLPCDWSSTVAIKGFQKSTFAVHTHFSILVIQMVQIVDHFGVIFSALDADGPLCHSWEQSSGRHALRLADQRGHIQPQQPRQSQQSAIHHTCRP